MFETRKISGKIIYLSKLDRLYGLIPSKVGRKFQVKLVTSDIYKNKNS